MITFTTQMSVPILLTATTDCHCHCRIPTAGQDGDGRWQQGARDEAAVDLQEQKMPPNWKEDLVRTGTERRWENVRVKTKLLKVISSL